MYPGIPEGRRGVAGGYQMGAQTVTTTTAATKTLFSPVSREMADDRWIGLMLDQENPDDPSDLSGRLIQLLKELAGGMGRETADGTGVLDDLSDCIGEWLVAWTMAGGVSPTEGGQVVTFTGNPWKPAKVAATA
jgi:hypothetical protein